MNRGFSTIRTQVIFLTALFVAAFSNPVLAAEVKISDPGQIARGAKAWSQNCSRCHNLRSPNELNPVEIEVSVMHMRVRANLPGQDARDIIAFLKSGK